MNCIVSSSSSFTFKLPFSFYLSGVIGHHSLHLTTLHLTFHPLIEFLDAQPFIFAFTHFVSVLLIRTAQPIETDFNLIFIQTYIHTMIPIPILMMNPCLYSISYILSPSFPSSSHSCDFETSMCTGATYESTSDVIPRIVTRNLHSNIKPRPSTSNSPLSFWSDNLHLPTSSLNSSATTQPIDLPAYRPTGLSSSY